jgi:hypothetical protein
VNEVFVVLSMVQVITRTLSQYSLIHLLPSIMQHVLF